MENLINAVQICLQNKNWYGALLVALVLPDICGKLEHSTMKSRERYISWFKKYLSDEYIHEVGHNHEEHIFLTGEDCYALRCSYIHEGVDKIGHQPCKKVLDKFEFFAEMNRHNNHWETQKKSILELDVKIFCEQICNAVKKWVDHISKDEEIKKYESEMLRIHTDKI